MGAYTIRRLLWIPVTVILVSMIVFLTVRFIPGNIVDIMESQMAQYRLVVQWFPVSQLNMH